MRRALRVLVGTDAAWSVKVWHAGSAAQFAFSVPGLLGCGEGKNRYL